MSNLLEVVSVSKRYQNHQALNEVSLSIPKHQIYGLLGPNGAGKTSLIRIINQIVFQDSGKIILDGEVLSAKHISQIGYMPEERGLYKSMTIGEQAMYLAQLKGLTKQQAKTQIDYWFQRLEITGWWNKKVEELSKGMAQKIQFVVTVLHQPKLLIFDEPFSGFDPVNASLIKDEIIALKEKGTTIIFSTHRMESVEEMCDSIALIHKSEKIIEGNLRDIKNQFRTNTYQIGITPHQPNGLEEIIQKWKAKSIPFHNVLEGHQLEIQLDPSVTSNDLLSYMIQKGSVSHFTEKIPSVNDIFIQSVKNN